MQVRLCVCMRVSACVCEVQSGVTTPAVVVESAGVVRMFISSHALFCFVQFCNFLGHFSLFAHLCM